LPPMAMTAVFMEALEETKPPAAAYIYVWACVARAAYVFSAASFPTRVELLEVFARFRKTPWFRILFVVLLGLIIGLAIPIAGGLGCVLILAIGVAMFAMPYLIGERRVRWMIVYALLLALIAVVVAAGLIASNFGTTEERGSSASMNGLVLSDGRVDPYALPGSSAVNYSIDVQSDNASWRVGDIRVFVVVTNTEVFEEFTNWVELRTAADPTDNLTGGISYSAIIQVPPSSIHRHRFEVFTNEVVDPVEHCPPDINATTWAQFWEQRTCVGTDMRLLAGAPRPTEVLGGQQYGPVTATGGELYAFAAARQTVFMLFPLLTFFLVLLMYWWTRRAREVRQKREARMGDAIQAAGGEFTCSNCGTDVPGAAVKCPKCGAVFDEPEAHIKPEKTGDAEKEPEPAKGKTEGKPAERSEKSRRSPPRP